MDAENIGHMAKNFVIGLGIFILTMFVVTYGINAFYDRPENSDFCGKNLYLAETESECARSGGVWNENTPKEGETLTREGNCRAPESCYDDYDKAREKFSKKVFYTSIPLGILILALGAFVFNLSSVGVGLMFGGIGTLIYGSGGYWRYADDWVKFIISLLALIVLIFLAYWFNHRKRG